MNRLDRENKEKEKNEQELIKKCEEIKNKIEKITLDFKVKTGLGDKVFGSISPKQIIEELKKKGYEIDKKQIRLQSTLDTLGYHYIDIELHKKVVAKLKIQLIK